MTEDQLFAHLRSLAHGDPSQRAHAQICRAILQMEESFPGAFAERYQANISARLDEWPLTTRLLRADHWVIDKLCRALTPEFITSLEVKGMVRHKIADVRQEFADALPLQHLTLRSLQIKSKELLAAIDDGLFDGLVSVEIANSPINAKLFDAILTRLEDRDACASIVHLRFSRCQIKAAQLDRLISSSIAGRLETIGLSHNTNLKSPRIATLAENAGTFTSLRRLELRECGLSATGAKALANASWPHDLEHLDISHNNIKPPGFKALDAAGRLPWLVDSAGDRDLDLSGFTLDKKCVSLMCEAGCFDDLGALRSHSRTSPFATLRPIVDRPDALRALRTFELPYAFLEDEDEAHLQQLAERFSLSTFVYMPSSDGAAAALLRSPGLTDLAHAQLYNFGVHSLGPSALEALLDHPNLGEMPTLLGRFEVSNDSNLRERARHALTGGREEPTPGEPRHTYVYIDRGRGVAEDAIVDDRGYISTGFLFNRERMLQR